MKVWNWEGFWGYFTNLYLLEGALWTIGLTISTLILGGMIGLLLAVMRLARHKALSRAAEVYVWIFRGTPTMLGAASGAVAGLVAITPACGWVGPMGSLVIGGLAGVVCLFAVTKLKSALGYDDSLDVFGVHGIGGITGTILAGVFAVAAIGDTAGLIEGNSKQVLTQLYGVVVVLVWSGVVTLVLLKVIAFFLPLRVREEDERVGLDVSLHGESLQ